MIAAAIVTGCFLSAEYFQMNRQSVERRFHFGARVRAAIANAAPAPERRHSCAASSPNVDQVQAGADFVVAWRIATGGIGSRLG